MGSEGGEDNQLNSERQEEAKSENKKGQILEDDSVLEESEEEEDSSMDTEQSANDKGQEGDGSAKVHVNDEQAL